MYDVIVEDERSEVRDWSELGLVQANTLPVDLVTRYAIKSMLDAEEVSVVHGNGNVGKTAFACALGAHVCRGAPFQGRRVTKGMVIHNAAEAPKSAKRRIWPLLHDVPDAAPYLVLDTRIDLGAPRDVADFIDRARSAEAFAKDKVRLVIFDTANLSMGDRDENSTRDASDVMEGAKAIARTLACHVMIVHHSGKSGENTARGSSVFRDNADAAFGLRLETRDDKTTTLVTNNKKRDAELQKPIAFRIEPHLLGHDQDGDPISTAVACFIDAADHPGRAGKTSARETVASRRAPAIIAALEKLTAASGAAANSHAVAEIRRACDMRHFTECGSDASRDKAVERVLDTLATSSGNRVIAVGRKRFGLAPARAPKASE